jgi:exosortase A-associated hydrolase 2
VSRVSTLEAFYLPVTAGGRRFCVYRAPATAPARAAIVYLHPFAEEMNKSRRMAALGAQTFAQAGHAVLQIDLGGCGDSSGEFGDATWAQWLDDTMHALQWMRRRHPDAPLWLWGLRAGCLLAVRALPEAGASNLLLWQPVVSGNLALQQFLRLKLGADILAQGGAAKGALAQLRAALAAGESVTVAGYRVHPELAAGLDAAGMSPPAGGGRVVWLEVSAAGGALSPAASQAGARWADAGWTVDARSISGPAFWQTTEIELAPDLITASVAALDTVPSKAPVA